MTRADRAPGGPRSGPDAGFTLVEMLVALAVFSLAVLALLNLAGESTRTAGLIETRAMAAVVAENRAVEVLTALRPPAAGETEGEESAGAQVWRWRQRVSATADPAILRIDISVTAAGSDALAADLVVFRGRS